MRMIKEAGPIRQGAQAVGDVVEGGVDLATGLARGAGGLISQGAEAVSDLFAPAQYEEVPEEE